MSRYSTNERSDYKLRRHLLAIRDNQVSVAHIILFLAEEPPNASAAQECIVELGYDGIDIWACSTKDGGMWETWQRAAMKTGELSDSYNIYCRRMGR